MIQIGGLFNPMSYYNRLKIYPQRIRLVFSVQNITLTEENVTVDGGITLTSMMNPDTNLSVGNTVMQEINIRFLNSDVFNNFDWTEEFRADFGYYNGEHNIWMTLGYFKGKKPQKTLLVDTIDFVAYDRMQNFDKLADDFIDSLTFPNTLFGISTALNTYLGISATAGQELEASMDWSFTECPFDKGITCRKILSWIAEACGCNAKITNDGYLKFAWYQDYTSSYTITSNDYYGIDSDEVVVTAYDSIRISSTYDENYPSAIFPVAGTNPYEVIDNPILLSRGGGERSTYANAMVYKFSILGNYTPISLSAIGNFCIESGDIIGVTYLDGNTVALPVFNKTMVWNGFAEDAYECTGNGGMNGMSQTVKEQYETGSVLKKKYTVQSGVDITDEGITISGGKFVKITSGGGMDVDSDNFKLDSRNQVLQAKRWRLHNNGLMYDATIDRLVSEIVAYNFYLAQFTGNTNPFEIGITDVDTGKNSAFAINLRYNSTTDKYEISLDKGTGFGSEDKAFCLGTVFPVERINSNSFEGNGVKNTLTETNAGYVLDARQGKALDDKFDGITFKHASVASTGNSFTIANNSRIAIDVIGAAAGRCGSIIIYAQANGTINYNVLGCDNLTITATTNKLSISGYSCTIYCRVYAGSITKDATT